MKRVSSWFKIGLILGFIWVVLGMGDFVTSLFDDGLLTDTVGYQFFKLGLLILGLVVKFFILGSVIFYLLEKTSEYDRQQEANKNKFEFELHHLNKDGTVKDC